MVEVGLAGAMLLSLVLAAPRLDPAQPAAGQAELQAFDEPTAEAQALWRPDEQSLPVEALDRDDGTALRLRGDFTGDSRRAVYDRDVELDLTQWDRLTLDVYVDRPSVFGHLTLFFRAPGGWYGASVPLGYRGWKTLHFPRSAFITEGNPAGWDQITGIRLSAWRGSAEQGWLAVDRLMAYRDDKVILLNTAAQGSGEWSSVQQYADGMSERLAAAGLNIGAVTDDEAADGALAGRKLVILPLNPVITDDVLAALRQFVADGGKLLAFYVARPEVLELLGLEHLGYQAQAWPGEFSRIRFNHDEVKGLPRDVAQQSWNIQHVKPARHDEQPAARVIGWWLDDQGRDTERPAFTLAPAGVYMSHVLTGDDSAPKTQALLALMGYYAPDVWPTVCRRAVAGPDQIGPLQGREAARNHIAAQADDVPADRTEQVLALLTTEAGHRAEAEQHLAAQRWVECLEAARLADAELREAYLRLQPSRAFEFRAFWEHSGTGAHGDWAASMRNLRESGFNAVIPNMLWGGLAFYDSAYLPHAAVVAERGDQIAEAVAAAKPYGIEVHVWKVNWNLGPAPAEFIERMRQEDRLQVHGDGEVQPWLCPSDPRNQDLEYATMLETARNYDVQGVHFDYIRYPHENSCFCDGCRQRFAADTGVRVEDWPAGLRAAQVQPIWDQWRCDNISRLVQRVAEGVRAIKPHVLISAAVFSNYPDCRRTVAQDWVHWIDQGWLDFVCPMDYSNSDATFAGMVSNQTNHIRGRVPLYPGIGATASSSALSADRVAGQIGLARALGADGFVVFNYDRNTADTLAPQLGQGATAQVTATPHGGPGYRIDVGNAEPGAIYGRPVTAGETIDVMVTRRPDTPGRIYTDVQAEIVLESADGQVLATIGTARAGDQTTRVQITVPPGVSRVVVRGSAVSPDGQTRAFAVRSVPLVAGVPTTLQAVR